STKKVLKETSDKRKQEKEALEKLQGKDKKVKKPVTNPVLRFFIAIGRVIGKVVRFIKDKLIKVPVLSILIDEEDAVQSAKGGTGNPIILFAMRMIPFVPANPISSLFGNMQMDYRSFLGISLLGYLVKVISFTAIGYNIADPFSSKFIVPFIVLLYLSAVVLLILNRVLAFVNERRAENEKNAELEKRPLS
ncbi:MAG: TVP38/TMEM64 family protein, partial [Clostridia bacterium]|nr:TVP38/TMEM64 family protein [Clostridia bacterium]